MPSIKDWQYILIGCGLNVSYQSTPPQNFGSYSGLSSKLSTAKGTALTNQTLWASDTYSDDKGWCVWFCDESSNKGIALFTSETKGTNLPVRAVLAF